MSSGPVCVIVRGRAKPDKVDEVKAETRALIEKIRANPGCLDCRVYQDRQDPTQFAIWERWVSAEAGAENYGRKYMAGYVARIGELFDEHGFVLYDEVHSVEEAL